LEFIKRYLRDSIPEVQLINPEGTFLAWLDFRKLDFEAKGLERFLVEHAQVALNSGYWFGRQGAGYARMTFACPKTMLEKALLRLEQAIQGLRRLNG
jgi:cystathionine beta-lyase